MASGSVQVNFGPTHLKKIVMAVPPEKVTKQYYDLTMPIIKMMLRARKEKQRLFELKNLLLNKLIKGEIDVSRIQL